MQRKAYSSNKTAEMKTFHWSAVASGFAASTARFAVWQRMCALDLVSPLKLPFS